MEWIEVSARTLEAAIEVALDSLGVHESELEYEVLADAKSGFLGIGRGNARIRARVRPLSREKPQDRRRRKRGDQRRGAESKRESGEGTARSGGGSPRTKRAPDQPSGQTAETPEPPEGSGPAGAPPKSPRRRKPKAKPAAETGAGRDDQQEEVSEMADAAITVDEQIAEAQRFTQGLLDALDVQAQVSSRYEDDHIFIDVDGEALGTLVGPKGATLSAIEELVRTAVVVRGGGGGARILVDVAGYRRKRREALAGFATRLAEEVLASGVAKALEPMSSSDRKVVHDTVSAIEGVATTSEGEDPRRRVVIRPA